MVFDGKRWCTAATSAVVAGSVADPAWGHHEALFGPQSSALFGVVVVVVCIVITHL